jgi:hypothetical protein
MMYLNRIEFSVGSIDRKVNEMHEKVMLRPVSPKKRSKNIVFESPKKAL